MSERSSQGVLLSSDQIPYHEIHGAFSATEHGMVLSQAVRYDEFRPPHLSNDQWQELLGMDVNNLDHMHISYHLADRFVRFSNNNGRGEIFTPEDTEILLLAATIHDWGESEVGDISYRLKTEEHEREEQAVIERLISLHLNGGGYDEEDVPLFTEKMMRACQEVVGDRESRLGRAFNAVERMGYLRTAIRAWRMSDAVDDDATSDSLRWVTAEVFGGQPIRLMEYADEYPAVQEYFANHRSHISDVFHRMPDGIFEMYRPHEREARRELFYTAGDEYRVWTGEDGEIMKIAD